MDLRLFLRPAAVLLLAAAPAAIPLHAALAQVSLGSGGGSGDSDRDAAEAAQQAEAKAAAKAAAPPPAIPGAVSDEATATSGHVSADMEPTAALFDAINRGDVTSAKEALSRGADLKGKNVLGQSPLDMAIDLNRSDITFVLLSMRNSENGPPVASIAGDEGDAASPAARRHSRNKADTRLASADRGTGRGPDRGNGRTGSRSVTLQRVAADNGTPNPTVGFLGFGGS